VARRLIRFASEDVGLADPNALVQAVAAFQVHWREGRGERGEERRGGEEGRGGEVR
jgi:replication-associated recombination protein RarA